MPHSTKRFLSPLFILFLLVFSSLAHAVYDPVGLYLAIENDPTRHMTVRWITEKGKSENELFYRQRGYPDWKQVKSEFLEMPEDQPYLIHRVALSGLEPDSEYIIKIGEEGKEYKFKTLPQSPSQPIQFVVGGDIYHDDTESYAQTNRTAAAMGPHFAVLGGDIAYSVKKNWFGSSKDVFHRWLDWLQTWKETMITPTGHSIPMIMAIGNHEVIGSFSQSPEQAKFFYALFKYPETKAYSSIDFGKYMTIMVLDSGHTQPIEGVQREWLYSALTERADFPHKFAVYHVPAYPSYRKFKGPVSALIRSQWVPLFEQFGLNAAFEHHDHTYKRTHPIARDKIDPENGVLYLGDGAWGIAKPRRPDTPSDRWYLACTESKRHFIFVVIDDGKRHFMAVDSLGKIFDYTTH